MTVIVLDFGGQYNQLIARRVREAKVYSEILPYTASIEEIKKHNPQGIILTGGPNSVYEKGAPAVGKEIFELGIPILGICYGAQVMSLVLGGGVHRADHREYGFTSVDVDTTSRIFDGMDKEQICWMSHTDQISNPPDGFKISASTPTCPVAAMQNDSKKLYAVQFHPEVRHTKNGQDMLVNFLYKVCGCKGDWNMADIAAQSVEDLKKKIGKKRCCWHYRVEWIRPLPL